MSEYATLASMGLSDVEDIHRFSTSEKDGLDIIKVQFNRPETSVLPDSASFSFRQDDIAQQQKKLDAIEELTRLTANGQVDNTEMLTQLEQDLDRMETVMKSKLNELRQEVAAMFPEDNR